MIFLLFLLSGCTDNPSTTPTSHLSTSAREEGIISLFSNLMIDHLGTTNDFETDYTEARNFLDYFDGIPHMPTSQELSRHLENTFRVVRKILDSSSKGTSREFKNKIFFHCPREITQFLLAIRFVRNAAHTVVKVPVTARKDQGGITVYEDRLSNASSDYLQLAKRLLREDVSEIVTIAHQVSFGFPSVLAICVEFSLFQDCPTHSLRAQLAIYATALMVDRVRDDKNRYQLSEPTNRVINFFVAVRVGCKPGTDMTLVQQRLAAYMTALEFVVVQVPSKLAQVQPVPIAEFVKQYNEQIIHVDDTIPNPHC
jgi:hypothetical protein